VGMIAAAPMSLRGLEIPDVRISGATVKPGKNTITGGSEQLG
jgi:hypothetical protein